MQTSPLGALLTFAQHKGYALATLCEVLGGALSGGQTTHQESLQTSVDAIFNCMTTMILRPDAFDAPDSQAQTEAFIAWCKQSPHDADAPVLAPGEWEAANREARLAQGIPLDAGSWQAICAAARDVGLSESHSPAAALSRSGVFPAERLTSALCVIVISDEVTLPSSSI
jgi:uncharacterized oxidoreductase